MESTPHKDFLKSDTEASALRQDVHYYGANPLDRKGRANVLLLLFRALSFVFSLAAVALMGTDRHYVRGTLGKVAWYNYDPYRYVFAVNAIICLYSFVETWLAVWTVIQGTLFLPETFQIWFDFGHDLGFSYLLFSAVSAGAATAQLLQTGELMILESHRCGDARAFCTQAAVSIALGFGAFLFLALSSLVTGLRVARWWLS